MVSKPGRCLVLPSQRMESNSSKMISVIHPRSMMASKTAQQNKKLALENGLVGLGIR